MPKKVDILLIALSSPIKIGIYENSKLIESIESAEKSSDVLPILYKSIFDKYDVEKLLYTNGPGSFMAIKVAYIFLKSLSILKKTPLYAISAFYFNENNPIKAMGKLYFVKIGLEIQTKKFESTIENKFTLPNSIRDIEFSTKSEPFYKIGFVG